MKKWIKIILFIALTFIFFAGCSDSGSVDNKLESFKKAVDGEDAEALYDLVEVGEGIHWSAKHAQDVIDNYNRTENNYSMQIEEFEEQLAAIENDEPIDNEKNKFYFDEDGDIQVRGYEFYTNNSGLEDADEIIITVEDIDEEFVVEGPFTDEEIIIGTFGPGDITFEATAKHGDKEITDKNTVEMNSADYQRFEKEVSLSLGGQSAEVITDIPDMIVLNNGSEVEEIVDRGEVNMIEKGSEIQGVQRTSWGEIVSEPLSYEGNDTPYDVTPHIFMNESDRKEITRVIDYYYSQLYDALTEDDKSILADVSATKEVITSHDKDFDDIGGNNLDSYFGGEVQKTTVDFGDASVTDEGYLEVHADIYSNFQYFITEYDESEKDDMRYQFKTVHLNKLDSGDWEIVHQEGNYRGSDEPNLKGDHLSEAK